MCEALLFPSARRYLIHRPESFSSELSPGCSTQVIGYISLDLRNRGASEQFTFGWVRAEVVGAQINGVFLLAVCLSLVVESTKRFVQPEEVDNPKLLLIVGALVGQSQATKAQPPF